MNFSGTNDVIQALSDYKLALYLAWADIRQRYRRSTLGPFWITISTAVMVASMGLIFGNIFKSPLNVFLPFLATGLITWRFISTTIHESTSVFSDSEAIIKQLPIPLFTHVLRMIFRNVIIYVHNFIIIPLTILILNSEINFDIFLFLPGFLLLFINLSWISLLLGIICSRYRDVSQIISSLLQIVFYVTPIMWMPSMLPQRASTMIIDLNPMYYLIQIVRAPWLATTPNFEDWFASLLIAFLGWTATLIVFNKYKNSIPYWV